jgi:lipopolysaccharide heptosyltransferase II
VTAAAWERARRVLAVRLDSMGDVLMTGPALRALKAAAAGRRITLLTSLAGAEAAGLLAEVDDVICYDAPWLKATAPRRSSRPDRQMTAALRAGGYDAAVIFTVYSQSPLPAALACYLADIPLRLAHCRENPYQLLTDWVPDPEPQATVRHEVRRQLDLVAAAGCPAAGTAIRVAVPAAAQARVAALIPPGAGPLVAVHPGASAPSRRYPAAAFAAAARELAESGSRIIFTGAGAESATITAIQQAMGQPSLSVAGLLTLAELAALLSRADVLVSNNTGPVHLAAGVGTPVVDLYAQTNPQHTPWGVPHRLLFHDVACRWCYKSVCPEGHHDCLRLVPPAAVAGAVWELLGERAPAGGGAPGSTTRIPA